MYIFQIFCWGNVIPPPKYAKLKENWKIALSNVSRLFRVTEVSPDVPVESSYALPSLGDDLINT